MYARPEHDRGTLDFGVSGRLIMNSLVMYDRQTESYWSQLLGTAVQGPLSGTALEPVPAAQMTWGEWRRLHPESRALRTDGWDGRDPYDDYYDRADAGVIGEANPDRRLPPKSMVTGAVVGGVPVAYPWAALAPEPGVGDVNEGVVDVDGADGAPTPSVPTPRPDPASGFAVVNDVVGEVPVLVVHAREASSTVLFDRRAGGRTLTFRSDPASPSDAVGLARRVVDLESGSRWSAWTGTAVDGPMAGRTLEILPSAPVYWFAWSDFYPGTRLYASGEG